MLKSKVLYVDDEETNVFIMNKLFENDFPLISTMSVIEALELIEQDSEIRLVITDMNMPEMSGLELVRKSKPTSASVEFVIVTGDLPNAAMKQAVQDGLIRTCIYRPYNRDQILSLVESLDGDS
jgi:DNA-binding NtrC family response regulator